MDAHNQISAPVSVSVYVNMFRCSKEMWKGLLFVVKNSWIFWPWTTEYLRNNVRISLRCSQHTTSPFHSSQNDRIQKCSLLNVSVCVRQQQQQPQLNFHYFIPFVALCKQFIIISCAYVGCFIGNFIIIIGIIGSVLNVICNSWVDITSHRCLEWKLNFDMVIGEVRTKKYTKNKPKIKSTKFDDVGGVVWLTAKKY